jgi:dTDP-4-dehydrorhamnose 3,5-epimerase-like enzyme
MGTDALAGTGVPDSGRSPRTVEIRQLKVHADGRGAVFEPLEPELLHGWGNVHTVITRPGAVRGNHRHLRGTEITTVFGPMLVRYRLDERVEDMNIAAGEAWRFLFPPGTAHAFKNTGSEPCILVSFNTEVHDAGRPDLERDELITR